MNANLLEPVPSRTTWPPLWLTSSTAPPAPSTPPAPATPLPVDAEPPLIDPPPPAPEAAEKDERPARVPPGFPPGAELVIADENAYYPSDRRFSGPYMWTWINAPTWFYVKDYPIPDTRMMNQARDALRLAAANGNHEGKPADLFH